MKLTPRDKDTYELEGSGEISILVGQSRIFISYDGDKLDVTAFPKDALNCFSYDTFTVSDRDQIEYAEEWNSGAFVEVPDDWVG